MPIKGIAVLFVLALAVLGAVDPAVFWAAFLFGTEVRTDSKRVW